MKTKSSILSNVIILAAGILLCIMHSRQNILHTIVFITGITLIVPGLINLVLLFSHNNDEKHRPTATMKLAGWVTSVAAITLGAIMIVAPGLFTPFLIFIFGAGMALASLMMIYMMSAASKQYTFPGWLYTGPVLVLIAGVVMVCVGQPRITDNIMILMTGISMVLYSLTWIVTVIVARRIPERTSERVSVPTAAQAQNYAHGNGGEE